MRATILRSREAVHAIAPQWEAIKPLTPFSSWDFACDWLACTPSAQPFVIAVHDRETLVGVAPWCLIRHRAGSTILTGIGRESAWYHDPLVIDTADAKEVLRAMGHVLRPRQWDAINLTLQVRASLPLIRALRQLGLAVAGRPDDRQSHLIAFDADWATAWERFPASFRKSLSRRRRRLEAMPHHFHMLQGEQAMVALEELIRLNRSRWKTGENWEPAYAFMRLNTPNLLARGDLRFSALTIEGRPAALDYQVRKGDRSSMIMANFQPDFADLSPGNLLMQWTLEQLHQEGIREVDMGPGLYEWKENLQSETVATIRTHVGSSLLGMALVGWQDILKPRLQPAT
ncbi:hypothetical protein D3C86_520070 [compost metagenome]